MLCKGFIISSTLRSFLTTFSFGKISHNGFISSQYKIVYSVSILHSSLWCVYKVLLVSREEIGQ